MPSMFHRDFASPLDGPSGSRQGPQPSRPRSQPPLRRIPILLRRTLPSPKIRALALGLLTAGASSVLAAFGGPDSLAPQTRHLSLSMQPGLGSEGSAELSNPLAFQREGEPSAEESKGWTTYTLRQGETLSQLGERAGLGKETAMALARSTPDSFPVRKMRAGHTFRIRSGADNEPTAIRYQINEQRYLSWQPDGDGGFKAKVADYSRTTQVREAFGRIETSLFAAGRRAGLSDKTIMELAHLFGWDIDLAHDIRAGDWFRIIYQEVYRGGEKVADGPILAAEFVVRGKRHRVVRFPNAEGNSDYYHPDGRSVRKAFLRTPVRFDRITSGFSRGREHPLLGERRAHEGVDYGASPGTPVRATGDGRVSFRGRKGGYGRVVKIRHAGRFTTVYAHLSGFDNLREGQKVDQGQTIGYVGQSGLATGPHLHYEFQVRGDPRDPLKVDLPDAEPLPREYQDAFQKRSHHYTAWLARVGPPEVRLAGREDSETPS